MQEVKIFTDFNYKNCLLSSLCPHDTERKSNHSDKKLLQRNTLKKPDCKASLFSVLEGRVENFSNSSRITLQY